MDWKFAKKEMLAGALGAVGAIIVYAIVIWFIYGSMVGEALKKRVSCLWDEGSSAAQALRFDAAAVASSR